ncbi:MAG: hypothetical protein HXY18_12655 [Bryobacteraceae bacterium]|nr:hypothetical protein [Bryobacteraceae bacterium]
MTTVSLRMVPVRQWVHRTFEAADPWEGGRLASWNLVVYRLVSASFAHLATPEAPAVAAGSNAIPPGLAVGIETPERDRHRILPRALQNLWRAGKVGDRDLPWLINRVETNLRRGDYPGSLMPQLAPIYMIVFGLIAAILLAAYVVIAPAPGRVVLFESTDEWLKAPLAERDVSLSGRAQTVELVRLESHVRRPQGISAGTHRDYAILAVLQAPAEKRLALMVDDSAVNGPSGAVLKRLDLNLDERALEDLRRRFPDLNTGYVLCTGWHRNDALSPADVELYPVMKWGGLGTGFLALLFGSIHLFWSVRRRRQAAAWLALVDRKAMSAGAG